MLSASECKDFSILNLFFRLLKTSTPDIFVNALSFACETSEILLLLVLAKGKR